jgi:16S rRNA (cytidine1402-2'-O)-methyltransferase
MHKLFVISTPIGNKDDISKRAINTLKNVNCVLAEDTRVTSNLFKLLNIENKLMSLHK